MTIFTMSKVGVAWYLQVNSRMSGVTVGHKLFTDHRDAAAEIEHRLKDGWVINNEYASKLVGVHAIAEYLKLRNTRAQSYSTKGDHGKMILRHFVKDFFVEGRYIQDGLRRASWSTLGRAENQPHLPRLRDRAIYGWLAQDVRLYKKHITKLEAAVVEGRWDDGVTQCYLARQKLAEVACMAVALVLRLLGD